MPVQAHPRVRKRLPCAVRVDGDRQQGLTLNLSRSGLFVQTDAGLGVGSRLDLELTPPALHAIPVQASVVWRKAVPRSLRGVSHSGLGVRLHSPPQAYEALVASLLRDSRDGARPSATAWRVRLRFGETQRSRALVVVCDSEEEATRVACEQQGDGWSVLDLSRIS